MIRLYSFIFLSIFTACDKNVVQTPAEQQSDNFILQSSQREKQRQTIEYELLEKWMKDHPQYQFKTNPYGFWVDLQHDSENTATIEDLDYVQYIKQYKNLDSKIIYTYEEQGIQNMILGKTEEIRGIETALRSLNEGDKAVLLLPSFMAYGLYGDENKIGAHQPLIVELEVLKVKKKL